MFRLSTIYGYGIGVEMLGLMLIDYGSNVSFF